MKNVLLPTDLTLASLYPIHAICKKAEGEKCNIYVIHTLDMPTGIMDLLFLQEKKPYKMLPAGFLEAFEMMRQRYASVINLLSFEFVWSNSRAVLRSYCQAREIQSIYLLKDHEYKGLLTQSANCVPVLHKCKLPVVYASRANKDEYGTLTALLYREEKMHA
jgi:hypothetical protein